MSNIRANRQGKTGGFSVLNEWERKDYIQQKVQAVRQEVTNMILAEMYSCSLSRYAFSQLIGIPYSTLYKWMKREDAQISILNLLFLGEKLGYSIEFTLIDSSGNEKPFGLSFAKIDQPVRSLMTSSWSEMERRRYVEEKEHIVCEKVAEFIRLESEALDMNMKTLARYIGVPYSTFRKWMFPKKGVQIRLPSLFYLCFRFGYELRISIEKAYADAPKNEGVALLEAAVSVPERGVPKKMRRAGS